ncbi:DNA topoisomerase IV subunit B [Candidatus Comchoanobacter bicostacola]|uniref:DNA topoisomerase 4 subunit B n=1 Tax=Candidatus Comchoanobacter bicostacola TaxID=2919598 RepID=A0ABY5DJI3_9GAMM|nr:DNA topoisomerase IV subunit B [Candidatus Comchoanobacter bicostacola]UTC24479.1 DNA topoisomerase IV subunit B [Candidatus Comchoanobacter bicostacola]
MTQYTASSIEVLEGLEPVQKRPGMYTHTEDPLHTACELIDNAADEALNGYASRIKVVLHEDGSLSCEDDGRGMPVDVHPEYGMSGVEMILTKLHSGAKFSNDSYSFSGGLHGVGVSVVNALAKKLVVSVKQGGSIHQIVFEHGALQSPLSVIGSAAKRTTGTALRYWPDAKYFDKSAFPIDGIKRVLKTKAILCPDLTTELFIEATGEQVTWHYETGIEAYLSNVLKDQALLPKKPIVHSHETSDMQVDWVVAWNAPEGDARIFQESYVNLIFTADGGTHENGLRAGIVDAVREFCDLHQLLPRSVKLKPEDITGHCHYVMSFKMKDPQFVGQTKERLSSRSAYTYLSSNAKDAMSLWLNEHVNDAKCLAEDWVSRAQTRMRQAKKVTRAKTHQTAALPGKLVDCIEEDLSTELFLVEGDSAGGSARQARDKYTQAIMPLRGKIINTWEIDSDRVLASQEVHDIAVAIGVDPASEDISGLRYGKICILADADSDGAHIASLLCALFVRHFPALVKNGHIYVAMPPLYRIEAGKKVVYALDDDERMHYEQKLESEGAKNIQVMRFKGLGEMNPKQLRETTMHTDTRRLVQLTENDDSDICVIMDMLLAKKRAKDRKSWLEEEGDLAQI